MKRAAKRNRLKKVRKANKEWKKKWTIYQSNNSNVTALIINHHHTVSYSLRVCAEYNGLIDNIDLYGYSGTSGYQGYNEVSCFEKRETLRKENKKRVLTDLLQNTKNMVEFTSQETGSIESAELELFGPNKEKQVYLEDGELVSL